MEGWMEWKPTERGEAFWMETGRGMIHISNPILNPLK
jgi:hypothetical protein